MGAPVVTVADVASVPGSSSGTRSSAERSGPTAQEGTSTFRLQGPVGQAHWNLG